MAEVATPPMLIPSRRTLHEAEVIDVDELQIPEERPTRRRRIEATIDLTGDSDEELEMTTGPSPGVTAQRTRTWAHRQPSLPPPPRLHRLIPPVPRVPQDQRTHQSFPARNQARRVEAGVVRPISVPFAFEADLVRNEGAAGDRHSPIPGPIEAAPRSHHQPNMGLGGALLATVSPARRHAPYPRAHREPRERERRMMLMDHDDGDATFAAGGGGGWINFPGLSNRLAALFGFGPADDADLAVHDLLGYPDSARQVRFANRPPVEDYNTSYTHPDKPAGGFSHDFAQAEPTTILDLSSAGFSSKPKIVEYNTLLVCAKCQDPLIINAPSDDARTRRVFALRCGHLVDGKCVEKLIEEAESLPGYPLASTSKGKGKSKAKEVQVPVEAPVPQSSMRSRLRSHASATMVIGSAPPPSPAFKRQSAGKGKGKAKAKDVIEDQREWVCPVDKCESKHCSIKMDALWVPAKENGPIALFL